VWEQQLQAAYERGFEDGKTAAGALHQAEFRRYHQWLQRFDELAQTLRLRLHELSQEMERAAVRLAFLLAEHILGNELRQHPEQLEQLLRRALDALPAEARTIRIRIHPDTLEALHRAGSRIVAGQEEGITLVADPSVEPAGCILESPWGSVDAQLREQLQNLREQLQC
jgi:flagellar biosynthesis/type III secretory pathway protein FliH